MIYSLQVLNQFVPRDFKNKKDFFEKINNNIDSQIWLIDIDRSAKEKAIKETEKEISDLDRKSLSGELTTGDQEGRKEMYNVVALKAEKEEDLKNLNKSLVNIDKDRNSLVEIQYFVKDYILNVCK